MSPSDRPVSGDELPPPSGNQDRDGAMPDDIVAMITQHRRAGASARNAREARRWQWPPRKMWEVGKFASRWVVTLALRPDKAFEVLEAWDRGPALSDGKSALLDLCRNCGASNDPDTLDCWHCGTRDWKEQPAARATKPGDERLDRDILISARTTFRIVLTLAVVGTGIARRAPGFGILLLFCALSVWAGTFLRAEWKKAEKSPFFTLIVPWILLPVLIIVLLVALVIGLAGCILWFCLR